MCPRAGESACESQAPKSFSPRFTTLPIFPIPAPKFCGRGRAFPPPQTHLPAPFLITELGKYEHTMKLQSLRGYGLLLYLKHISLTRVRALTSPEFA